MARVATTRRFTLLDAIALVAAAAFALFLGRVSGLSVLRPGRDGWVFTRLAIVPLSATAAELDRVSQAWIVLATPPLATLAWALALLSLRRPRLPLRHLTRSPGVVACWAVAFAFAINWLHLLARWGNYFAFSYHSPAGRISWFLTQMTSPPTLRAWLGGAPPANYEGFRQTPISTRVVAVTQPGFAVLAAWVLLAINRRFRPESSWIGRTGRVIGVAWLAIMVVRWTWMWSDDY